MFKFKPEQIITKMPEHFNDIRPYNSVEAKEALKRLQKSDVFFSVLKYLFPEENRAIHEKIMTEVNSIRDFQVKIMAKVVSRISTSTMTNFSFSGLENLKKGESYLFISNHRDIFLDSALLQLLLVENGFDTTEITFGNNLMKDPLIVEVGKINKMFKVYRHGKPKELLEKTSQLSEYIRYAINVKNESVWIAQRGGRTKDGNDTTQASVIKMFNSSGKKTFEENIRELKVVPLSISYEYEPCDEYKVKELFDSIDGTYKKAEKEDFNCIIEGVKKNKGNVHISIGKVIDEELDVLKNVKRINEKASYLSSLIDKHVYKTYKLWPGNYIALDILNSNYNYKKYYTEEQKTYFETYINNQLEKIPGYTNGHKELLLKIYAQPVINSEK